MIKEREVWFSDFLEANKNTISAQDLINFHTKTKSEDF